ncbi:hypothetical protein KA017_01235 [Candidatus Woesebacteria bacterium]|nr:hypothetical protein [Candidatus Woesebacteria bacterium]
MKPGGYVIAILALIGTIAFCAMSLPTRWEIGETAYTHSIYRVNPDNYSTEEAWYDFQTNNCRIFPGAVKIEKGPQGGYYLVNSGNCQGWVPDEWLHATPKKE